MNLRPASPILLVDDSPANLLALEAVLQALHEPLVRAGSGQEALRRLRDADFAAVLLDVRMPDMDGFETARLIRAQRRSRRTPIIFVTADASDLSVEEAYAIGAVDFLTKPLVTSVLKAKLAFFVELHRSRQELQAAERKAVQDRAFLSAVLEAVEDGIVACGPDGKLTLFNRATREFHGVPDSVTASEAWAERRHDLYHADGVTPLAPREIPLVRALAGEVVRSAEIVIAPKCGKPRHVLANGQPLYDEAGHKLGAVLSMHDISAERDAQAAREAAVTEQTRREEAEAAAELIHESRERLRASEERVRLATDAAGLGVWALDVPRGTLTWENERLDRLFGPSPVDDPTPVRRFIAQFAHPEDADRLHQALAVTLRDGTRLHYEGRFLRHGDHALRWIELTGIAQAGSDGAPQRILGTAGDITDRKQAEDRLRRDEENLRRLAAKLAESDRLKTEFLATLAHELRNPLAPISNGLQLMRMATDPQALEKVRDMMERQLKHLVRLVDDLLDVARISSGKMELRQERIELRAVLDSAIETSMPLVSAARHVLDVRMPDEDLPVMADATRIAQVVSNLLNNAVKYTPEGGRIELSMHRDGGQAVVTISDSGVGIAPDALPLVFEMFTQVERKLDRASGGLGIGLALVRRLVELHGGSVSTQSAGAGKGSTFTVRLPLAQPLAAPLEPVHPAAAAPAASDAPVYRVLVVDDNVDAAESLAALLQLQGHATCVAHDGNQALSAAHDFRPEIVFLDIGMPGKDGYEVARELRGQPATRQAVLVALTGWGAREDRARTRSAGFDHHLTKPAGLADVEALMAGMAGCRREPSAA